MGAPAVIGEAAPRQPVLPVVSGPGQATVGLLVVLGWRAASPGERAEANVALLEQRARPGATAFQADPAIGGESEREVGRITPRGSLVVTPVRVLPDCGVTAIVED